MSIEILSPLSAPSELDALIAEGARHFYCGILPPDWRDNYSVAASLNRRQEDNPVLHTSPHMTSFDQLRQCCETAHCRDAQIIVTLNEHYYSAPQYPYLERYIAQCVDAGADAFIVGDPGIILTIRAHFPDTPIHISTAGTAFNTETVHFYRDLGATRVILPRHLSLEEIGEIATTAQDIELEAFILNSRCANIDGFCTFQHGLAEFVSDPEKKRDYENACMCLYKISADVRGCNEQEAEQILQEKISWERQHFWSAMHIDDRPCGACALHEFERWGLDGVKIVGRANAFDKKKKDVRFIAKLLRYLRDEQPDKQTFRTHTQQLYTQMYESPCVIFKCYYPSVLLEKETAEEQSDTRN